MSNPMSAAWQRLRLRRQSGELDFALADRIDFLNPAHWDALTDGRGFLRSRAYHQMLEAVRPENVEPRYALLYRGAQPVAAVSMQWIALQGTQLIRLPSATAGPSSAQRLRQQLAEQLSARVLVLGNLLSYGSHGISIDPAHVGDPEVWHAIGEAAYRTRRAEKHRGKTDFVLVKDLLPDELQQSGRLHDLGYRSVETEPNMMLALDAGWRSHDDYLAALSAKYRKTIRTRILAPFEQGDWQLERLGDVAAQADRLHALYLAVHGNAALRPVTLSSAYWPALAAVAGDRARFAIVRRGADLVGFVLTLMDDADNAIAYHIGFDRSVASDAPIYLRLLQQTIADGIALGARRLSFGRTALEPKAALGARPERLHVWVRHRQPVMNKLMRGLLGAIEHDEAPERNPFSAAAGQRANGVDRPAARPVDQ